MQWIRDLFERENVAGWMAYAGAERASRIDAVTGVVGDKNANWQAGQRPTYFLEAQRVGYRVVLGGIAAGDPELVSRGLRAIEWGYQPAALGPSNDWRFNRDFDTILAHAAHPRTMFGSSSVQTVLAILDHTELPSSVLGRASALVGGIGATASAYIASGDAEIFRTQCLNSSQIVFQATWLQGAYVLTENEAFKAEAKEAVRAMMSLQRSDGAFGERIGADGQPGFDTAYCVQTLRELVAYEEMMPGSGPDGGAWRTQVRECVTRGANWLLGRIRPDGSIDTTGNSRTSADGPPMEGSFAKGWDLDQVAITLAQYAVAFGRWDELAPTITLVQYRGQEYDHLGDIASGK